MGLCAALEPINATKSYFVKLLKNLLRMVMYEDT